MKRVATAALAGFIALVGLGGTAPAFAADGYGGATVKVTISHKPVEEKEDFTLKASVKTSEGDPVNCEKLTYTFRGDSNQSGKFTAPRVDGDKHFPISATCRYDADALDSLGGGGTGTLSTFVIVPGAVEKGSNTILVLDNDKGNGHHKKNKDDDDDNGNLPNTGGERLAWLVIGLLLVAAGSTVVVSSRKRDSVA
jgi:LPXTG-motif cell wall-anchored protein